MGADLGVVDAKVSEAWDKALAEMKRELWADMKAALPRSEMGRALMAELAAEDARERAARRCSDCVHLACGWSGSIGRGDRVFTCLKGRFNCDWAGNEDELRPLLRTAASCDDYEEVRDA